jgi:uncharacterized repeat protein (TIGR01451 family)
VRLEIDGTDTGQCFTTWEEYSRAVAPGQPLPEINSLEFRTSVAAAAVAGERFLFGDVSPTSDNGAGPPNCDVPITKTPNPSTVSAGGLVSYTLTARNRGRLTERNLLFCDHAPKHTTFVSADRTLRRSAPNACLFIRSLKPGQSTSDPDVPRQCERARRHPGQHCRHNTRPPTGCRRSLRLRSRPRTYRRLLRLTSR